MGVPGYKHGCERKYEAMQRLLMKNFEKIKPSKCLIQLSGNSAFPGKLFVKENKAHYHRCDENR